jgi:hypothetical protein
MILALQERSLEPIGALDDAGADSMFQAFA